MKPFVFLFPGQGSQSVGMMNGLKEFSEVKQTFDEASDVLHFDLWKLVSEGPEEKLNQTEFTQPAILTTSIACWRIWKNKNLPNPAFMAGHSLGEYSALVAAEALAFTDAVKLVSLRGRYMQEACPEGKGAMGAIVGLSNEEVVTICKQVAEGGIVSAANFNSLGQVVIAGEVEPVKRALNFAQEKGAKLAKLIPISVPSHCALMESAAGRLAEKLDEIEIHSPKIPVIHNVDVKMHSSPADIRLALIQQLFNPVRWVEIIQYIYQQNIRLAYEVAPGKVLTGLCKRIEKDLEVIPLLSSENFHLSQGERSVKL